MAGLGLKAFPKTSGGKGLHLFVPLNTPVTFAKTKAFARALARDMEADHPDRVLSKPRKDLRRGKVFIDWSQNDEHKTTVCVYSLRARERPTVSTPVAWKELEAAHKKRSAAGLVFEAADVLERVRKKGDLFAPVLTLRQTLPRPVMSRSRRTPMKTVILACLTLLLRVAAEAAPDKTGSAFFPAEARTRMRDNAGRTAWGGTVRLAVVEAAKPWLAMSDEALWELMFGPTITRSWMVWTNGHCPACRKPVPMYAWKVDALKAPWKMECPHCAERFPKNDFHAFHRSGLDAHGVFDPAKADRGLLFNAEHPRSDDPLRSFGVDDGDGYVEGDNRWRFIGAYLVYGQWKQAVLDGIVRLAQAHLLTGDAAYARKAVILLDRVADLYPDFDFKTQAVMYEGPAAAGYVSTWHDACEETRLMALAYDQVRDAIGEDPALQAFLAGQARKYKLENDKGTAAGIRRNIEKRILEDAIANRWKIRSNYPRTETALVIIKTVLGWPENRAEVLGMIDELVGTATAVDGVTGEKGLTNYAASTVANLAYVLALYDRLDSRFLKEILARHPALRLTYRFHYDTWFRGLYYPAVGDAGAFGRRRTGYAGATFLKKPAARAAIHHPEVDPSMFAFFMRLYEMTGDPAYVRVLYRENGGTVEGLPFDLLGPDASEFERRVGEVIAAAGSEIRSPGFNKERWHLAMLRSGDGDAERAVWIDYDTGGGHGHADGMNIGLFARGLDLMPDLGYAGAEAATAEGWISLADGYDTVEEAWIPRVMVRRRGAAEPLASAFVGLIEPYEGRPFIGSARRLPLANAAGEAFPDGFVALEVRLADGRRDLFLSVDAENPLGLGPSRGVDKTVVQKELGLRTDAEFALRASARTGKSSAWRSDGARSSKWRDQDRGGQGNPSPAGKKA